MYLFKHRNYPSTIISLETLKIQLLYQRVCVKHTNAKNHLIMCGYQVFYGNIMCKPSSAKK